MNCIIDLPDATVLIKNYGYAAVLIATVENISSNTIGYYSEIEPFKRYITNTACVELILTNPISITL